MTCKKCGYEFCWFCLHQHKGHRPEVCFCTVLAKITIVLLIIFNVLVLTGVMATFQRGAWNLFSLIGKIVIYDFGIFFAGCLLNLIRETSLMRYNPTRKLQVACFSVLLLLLAGIYSIGIWHLELFYHALYCTLGQFGGVACIFIHEAFFANWLRRAY